MDTPGGMQFEKAACALACGAAVLSVMLAWGRVMFMA
jgi:hypothetical protein